MMKKIIQGYIQVLPEEIEQIKACLNGTYDDGYGGKFINGVRFENDVCMTITLDKETKEITAQLYKKFGPMLAKDVHLSDYFGEILMEGMDGNLYQAAVVPEFEKGAANSWVKLTPEDKFNYLEEFKKIQEQLNTSQEEEQEKE